MKSDPVATQPNDPIDGQTIFAALRNTLAELYPKEEDARIVIADAGLMAGNIAFSTRAQTNWHNILAEAISATRLDALLEVACATYGSNLTLTATSVQYRQFIGEGGLIEACEQLPAIGDVVYEDKVGGDKITIGNITAPAAIGAGASVTVTMIHPTPPPRIPLERPSRAEQFQNRKDELKKLLADLQPGRVVTLCGPGGIGKTALAAEAVWQLPPARFPDGILFHNFYHRSQVDLAFEHIAISFGEELKPSSREAAQRALGGRRALLLLDGAEQADDLAAILEIRDQCGVLITSRQHKDAVAEHQDLLPLPPADAVALLQAWGGPRAADEPATRRISELVGRLPLAICLVGRYLAEQAENATDYLEWLEDQPLEALDQGERQLESVPLLLERSLTQVREQARVVVGIVGVFALSPFSWQTIAETLSISGREARQSLGELVNHGLLARGGETYEITHALIHTYARERLSPSTATVVRLGEYYTTFLNEHKGDWYQLNTLRPHVMVLLPTCVEREVWSTVSDLAWAIEDYLDLQGHWIDRITTTEAGLADARARQDRRSEGVWLGKLGGAYHALGNDQRAIEYYEQALVIAQTIGDKLGEGYRLNNLGLAYRNLGQFQRAIECHERAQVIAKKIGNRRGEGASLGNLGLAYYALGQVERAIEYYEQALVIAQAIGDKRSESDHLGNLGSAYYTLGQVEQAIEYHKQAVVIAKKIGDRRGEGASLGNLGLAYRTLGQVEQAIEYYKQALVIAQAIDDRGSEGTWLGSLGNAYAALGQVDQAFAYHQQALTIAQEIGDRHSEGLWLGNLGVTYAFLGQAEQAQQAWEQSLYIFEETKSLHATQIRDWLEALSESQKDSI